MALIPPTPLFLSLNTRSDIPDPGRQGRLCPSPLERAELEADGNRSRRRIRLLLPGEGQLPEHIQGRVAEERGPFERKLMLTFSTGLPICLRTRLCCHQFRLRITSV